MKGLLIWLKVRNNQDVFSGNLKKEFSLEKLWNMIGLKVLVN